MFAPALSDVERFIFAHVRSIYEPVTIIEVK